MNENSATTFRTTTLGEYMAEVYTQLLEIYGDPDLAAVAAAAMVNDFLSGEATPENTTVAA